MYIYCKAKIQQEQIDRQTDRTNDRKKQISGRVSDSSSFKTRKLPVNFW